jgi:RNA polymerase sigma-70 factor (ECF subfamily)
VAIDARLLDRLHRQANAGRWSVSKERFAQALAASSQRGGAGAGEADAARYFSGLHLEDLALACACADGHDAAWEHFVREHRPHLYRAAAAIDASGGARDLADSLYAELFGLRERDGERQSLFRYFHGRSSLSTWLRAILAQRHVDRLRATRRLDPLPEDESPAALPAPAREFDPDARRYLALIREALARVVSLLVPRDRLRLACYYAQELTLAQTGRLLKEHEATTSRQLAKTRAMIREQVEQLLKDEHHMSHAEVVRCFECAAEDPGPLDLGRMMAVADDRTVEDDRKKIASGRSTG